MRTPAASPAGIPSSVDAGRSRPCGGRWHKGNCPTMPPSVRTDEKVRLCVCTKTTHWLEVVSVLCPTCRENLRYPVELGWRKVEALRCSGCSGCSRCSGCVRVIQGVWVVRVARVFLVVRVVWVGRASCARPPRDHPLFPRALAPEDPGPAVGGVFGVSSLVYDWCAGVHHPRYKEELSLVYPNTYHSTTPITVK